MMKKSTIVYRKGILLLLIAVYTLSGCTNKKISSKSDFIIANGQMPNLVKDKNNIIQVVYGTGDSIMYTYADNNSAAFATPTLIKVLPDVYTFATRGPQIAATAKGLIVTACTSKGNIFSFYN